MGLCALHRANVYVPFAGSATVRYLPDLARHFFDLNQTACRVGGIRPRHLGQGGPPEAGAAFKIEPQLTCRSCVCNLDICSTC